MSSPRSFSDGSDDEELELDLDELEEELEHTKSPVPEAKFEESKPKIRLNTATAQIPLRPTAKATPKEEEIKLPRRQMKEFNYDEELDLLMDDEYVDVESDEEVPLAKEDEKRDSSRSAFRMSSSQGRGSPKAKISMKFPYRKTLRYTMKEEPDFNDLYSVAGKYITAAEYDTILLDAVSEEAVARFNQRHGTSFTPAKSDFATKKSVNRTLPKMVRVTRALLSPISRMMVIELLMKKKRTGKNEPVYDSTFSLSNKDVFIQFTDDGPKFPADHPDDRAMEEAAGLVSKDDRKKKSEETPKVLKLQVPDVIPPKLIELLRAALANDPENTIKIDQDRLEYMMRIMSKFVEMDLDALAQAEEDLENLVQE